MNWTVQILGFIPSSLVFWSTLLIQRKKVSGWVVVGLAEVGWLVFDVYVQSWTLVFWCGVSSILAVRGYRKWSAEEIDVSDGFGDVEKVKGDITPSQSM